VEGAPALPGTEPVKGHLIGYQQPAGTCHTIVRHAHTYLLQRASGLLICGASVERVGFDREISPDVVASIAEQAAFVFPHLRETAPSEVWTGLRPGSDALRVGCWHSNRLYLAYGHYRNGILLAPLTAERIANEITSNLRKQ
jgi:glycine oxidase